MKSFRILQAIILFGVFSLAVSCSTDEETITVETETSSDDNENVNDDDNSDSSDNGDDSNTDDGTTDGETETDGEDSSTEWDGSSLTLYSVSGQTISKIVDYDVTDSYLQELQEDVTKHEEIWDLVIQLIPVEQLGHISEFMIYSGFADGNTSGYVVPITGDLSEWRFAMSIDQPYAYPTEGFDPFGDTTSTIIHELGHILTLNDTQTDLGIESGDCSEYYFYGCMKSDSYFAELYNGYWADIITEYDTAMTNGTMSDFYDMYANRFVSTYASSHPVEDMAEVFTRFIVRESEQYGDIAEEKLQNLFAYNELSVLRDEIRSNITATFAKGGNTLKSPMGDSHQRCVRHH